MLNRKHIELLAKSKLTTRYKVVSLYGIYASSNYTVQSAITEASRLIKVPEYTASWVDFSKLLLILHHEGTLNAKP